MSTVYIVRHGNTFDAGDTVTRVGARTDLGLSMSGLAQAQALAAHFADDVAGGFSEAYCSPLLRTRQTAEVILATQSSQPPLEMLEFLREVDYGPDENQPEAAVIARIGSDALQLWETRAIPPQGWQIDTKIIIEAWGELFQAIAERQPDRPVLVVTSNGIARFALTHAVPGPGANHDIKLKTGAFGRFRIGADGTVTVQAWNVRPANSG